MIAVVDAVEVFLFLALVLRRAHAGEVLTLGRSSAAEQGST
jgi:hypothetical protein